MKSEIHKPVYYAVVSTNGDVLYCGRRQGKAAEIWEPGSFWASAKTKGLAKALARKKCRAITTKKED